jgi:hypothetical protein
LKNLIDKSNAPSIRSFSFYIGHLAMCNFQGRDQVAHIATRMARGYLDSNAQALNEMNEAIALIKHLLISTISDESIVLLADSLSSIIVVRGLPHCLSFEVTMPLPFFFHRKDKPDMIL